MEVPSEAQNSPEVVENNDNDISDKEPWDNNYSDSLSTVTDTTNTSKEDNPEAYLEMNDSLNESNKSDEIQVGGNSQHTPPPHLNNNIVQVVQNNANIENPIVRNNLVNNIEQGAQVAAIENNALVNNIPVNNLVNNIEQGAQVAAIQNNAPVNNIQVAQVGVVNNVPVPPARGSASLTVPNSLRQAEIGHRVSEEDPRVSYISYISNVKAFPT